MGGWVGKWKRIEGLEEQGHFLGLGNQFGVCDAPDHGLVTSLLTCGPADFFKKGQENGLSKPTKIKSFQFLKLYA